MAKKTTAKTKTEIAKQVLIAERNGYYRIVIVPGADGSECRVGGKLNTRAAAELVRDEIIKDMADGTYRENGYPAHAFETWARLHAFLDKEGVPDARELSKKLTLEAPWLPHSPSAPMEQDSEIPF